MAAVILSVGQCAPDDSRIGRLLSSLGALADRAATAEEAREKMNARPYDLILVNRIFDQDGDSGIEFIRRCKVQQGILTPMMLVSDYAEAQAQAEAAGARPGFGKSQLQSQETIKMLQLAFSGA